MATRHTDTQATWIEAFPLTELGVGAARVFRHAGRQIAVFRPADGELYAVDNHCPHEGYPLVQGYVKSCVLTCAWHNFKFDLRDGRCTKGDEDVRTWPVRLVEDRIEIDVSAALGAAPVDPVPLYRSLAEGLGERQLGRIARDVARLLSAGESPTAIAVSSACFDARHAEYGTTHALPIAVDVLRFESWRTELECVHPLLLALDMTADANVRRPARPLPEPVAARDLGCLEEAARELARLVEDEDAPGAEALVRGAVAAGWRDGLSVLLLAPLCEHHLGFGHSVIYTAKLLELHERASEETLGDDALGDLAGALIFEIVHSTREDTLPPWRAFRERLDALDGELAELWARVTTGARPPESWSPRTLLSALVDGRGREFFAELLDALRTGVAIETLAGVVSLAAAERVARFDVAIDGNTEVQDGWLFATHTLTHASAVRSILARAAADQRAGTAHAGPRLLRLLFFAARFVNGTRPLDRPGTAGTTQVVPAAARPPLHRPPATQDPLMALHEAIVTGGPERAAQAAESMEITADLERELAELALRANLARPIVATHAVKTTFAACDEARALSRDRLLSPYRALPLVALARFLASPLVERSLARMAHEAVRFVGHGEIPKVLSQ